MTDKVTIHPELQAQIDADLIKDSHMKAQRGRLIEKYAGPIFAASMIRGAINMFSNKYFEDEEIPNMRDEERARQAKEAAAILADEVLKEDNK